MSDDGNALGLGWPKSRILPPCLTGAHKEDCDRLCAEVAKNTGLEVPECGCRCHGRKPGEDGGKMNDQALGPDPVLTRLPNGRLEISWPNGRGRSCEASSDLVEQWVAQTNDLRAGLAVRDEALAAIAALHRTWYEINGKRIDLHIYVSEPPEGHACLKPGDSQYSDVCDAESDEHYVLACTECRASTDEGEPGYRPWPCDTQRILANLQRSLDPYRDDKEQQ